MRYAVAIRYLYALEPRGMVLGLGPMRRALSLRGHPERAAAVIHVAGTNGKGSVSAMLASALRAAGLRVGLFTSPHLHRLVERFQIDGRPMAERELGRRVAELRAFLERPKTPQLTFFELCTLLAFEWFRDQRCDVVVLEVGIGGRLDCTNVVAPRVSVITSVALDHQDKLGRTLTQIAHEKAGIIKPGVPVISAVRGAAAASVIARRAARLRAPLRSIDRDFAAERGDAGSQFIRCGDETFRVRLQLRGDYQSDNVACATAALIALREQGFPLPDQAITRGLNRTRWPGRLELLPGAPALLCDAAHNPAACRELVRYLDQLEGDYTRRVLLFGVLRDKDYARMLGQLLPGFDAAVFVTPASARALPAEELARRFGGEACGTLEQGLRRAQKRAGKRGLLVAAGSIFVMSSVRALALGLREDPKIAL
ncbi:MAG TPA: folylpolyglutamate synthase/dihydrofolate synthase family protein [Polyangiales bacterium]